MNVVIDQKSMNTWVASVNADTDSNINNFNSVKDVTEENFEKNWHLDYRYCSNKHNSVLTTNLLNKPSNLHNYEELSKDMDVNLAQADMESFRTEDIHALFTNLPPIYTYQISDEVPASIRGESAASISSSVAKLECNNSDITASSYNDEDLSNSISNSLSFCKSELLFSPVKETQFPVVNFSVDSLDCDMLLTCQANKNNYTIAFEESILESEPDKQHTRVCDETNRKLNSSRKTVNELHRLSNLLTQSDSNDTTTWNKVHARYQNMQYQNSHSWFKNGPKSVIRNPMQKSNDDCISKVKLSKSKSLPNFHKWTFWQHPLNYTKFKIDKDKSSNCINQSVKLFNVQRYEPMNDTNKCSNNLMNSSLHSSTNTSNEHPTFNLVKQFTEKKKYDTISANSVYSDKKNNLNDNAKKPDNVTDANNGNSSKLHTEQMHYNINVVDSMCDKGSSSLFDNKLKYNSTTGQNTKARKKCHDNIPVTYSEVKNLSKHLNYSEPAEQYKIIQASFLKKMTTEVEQQKPIYVMFPNYVLPNLDFLHEHDVGGHNLHLIPRKCSTTRQSFYKRTFSCNDFQVIKQKGVQHIQDWESLNFLLPRECRKMLAEIPEIQEQLNVGTVVGGGGFSREKMQQLQEKHCRNTVNTDVNQTSSDSSLTTQPSSGYRGSSTILSDSQLSPWQTNSSNPLFVYRYDSPSSSDTANNCGGASQRQRSCSKTSDHKSENTPTRPPIMRHLMKRNNNTKQDMYYKRRSLPEPYYLQRNKCLVETIEDITSTTSLEDNDKTVFRHTSNGCLASGNKETAKLQQLNSYLENSKTTTDCEQDDNVHVLKSYVGRFLNLKLNSDAPDYVGCMNTPEKATVLKCMAPNNSPNSSLYTNCQLNHHKMNTAPIRNECISCETTPNHTGLNLTYKQYLMIPVIDAIDNIVAYFASSRNRFEMHNLNSCNQSAECAQIVLSTLCPALYAFLCDDLKATLATSFGPIDNSLWQVIETCSNHGTIGRELNELVMRINSEATITEGVVKFNAFILGLLNVGSLDSWLGYFKTRESILKRHYSGDSLLVRYHSGGADVRHLLDTFIANVQRLASLPFNVDILFEYRQLHRSLKKIKSFDRLPSNGPSKIARSPPPPALTTRRMKSPRPRSCIEQHSGGPSKSSSSFHVGDVITAKRRWSGIPVHPNMYLICDKLRNNGHCQLDAIDALDSIGDDDGECRMCNEPDVRQLQQRCGGRLLPSHQEAISRCPSSATSKSRIPRPILSPSKEHENNAKRVAVVVLPASQLPVRRQTSKIIPSDGSPHDTTGNLNNKYVKTLTQKLSSENGHLPYKKGERLYVIMEVDDQWLLCSRGAAKGLVQRSSVMSVLNDIRDLRY